MQRLFLSAAILLSASASAQTSINITLPGTQGSCTYTTGPVLSNSVPGQLQATATSAVGAGCGSGGGAVSFGPATPLTPATTTLTSAGGVANLSFQAINATQCTGSITGAAGGVFTVGGATTSTFCNGSACAAAQSFSTSFPANADPVNDKQATVTATCQGASGSPVTSSATITVQHNGGPPPTGCTAPPVIAGATGTIVPSFSRLDTSVIAQYGGGSGGGPHTVDPRSFASIYFSAWPGEVWTATFTLASSKYISAAFTVPSNYFTALNAPVGPPLLGGYYRLNETGFTAPVSMTISTSCGDFSNPSAQGSTVLPGCYSNKATSTTGAIGWTGSTSCVLTGGTTTYYLNAILADIKNVTPGGGTAASTYSVVKNCVANTCLVPLTNQVSYPSYVPQ